MKPTRAWNCAKSRGRQAKPGALAQMSASMGSAMGELVAGVTGGAAPARSNPIGTDRKRMGFVVVADVSSSASFEAAYGIIDRLFDRLQWDVADQIACPVSVVIAGNKSDVRGKRREVEPEPELRSEILRRYENPTTEPRHQVSYVECSALTNEGLEQALRRRPATPAPSTAAAPLLRKHLTRRSPPAASPS